MSTATLGMPVSTPPASAPDVRLFYLLFFVSGVPALIYQIIWQRALFTIYGVNIQSVTVIVTVFMLGLGFGSLVGGRLSKHPKTPLLAAFAAIELGIGVFGFFSLRIFHAVAAFTAGASTLQTGLATFLLLLYPTLLMGSTLPILVAHLVRRNGNVGESVGALYSVNTFGSAAACFLTAFFLMHWLGESGCTRLAAAINMFVAIGAISTHFLRGHGHTAAMEPDRETLPVYQPAVPFVFAVTLAAGVGFVALGYEVIWYRIYSFLYGRTSPSFALMLGWYLAGVAYGSNVVWRLCRRKLRNDPENVVKTLRSAILRGNLAAFLVAPALAITAWFNLTFPFVFVGSALLGAAFPLISHAAIGPNSPGTGAKLGYLYLGNILGCAAGGLLVGFVLMDHLSMVAISLTLLSAGLLLGASLFQWRRNLAITRRGVLLAGLAVAVVAGSMPLYFSLYERILYKSEYTAGKRFKSLVETRSGVVSVSSDGVVFGGGVYDGQISTDLVHDVNGIFRAFAVSALHPAPKQVLLIGLSLGAWAQVIANNPTVERVTIVEIDPGYLQLIPAYPTVASLLHNAKVHIVIDDGRRWLIRNPSQQFDMVVMNTMQHWLAHASNLLSVEFLELVRQHLRPRGIFYYNTTFSPEAIFTGATAFRYSLRVANFIAVSDNPISFDKGRWKDALEHYTIDGKTVFDLRDVQQREKLTETLALADTLYDPQVTMGMHLETGDSLKKRFRNSRLVTDDNMATEW